MQIVIELTDEMYANVQAEVERSIHPSRDARWTRLLLAICNGEVLPKGHGALKDVDAIIAEHAMTKFDWSDCVDIEELKNAPTIIEADKEAADERHS